MDSNTGGQNESDLARRAAAEIARKKVLAAYAERAQQDARQNEQMGALGQGARQAGQAMPTGRTSHDTRMGQANQASLAAGTGQAGQAMRSSRAEQAVWSSQAAQLAGSAQPGGAIQHMKDVPVTPKINSESWRKYHSAWQDYYQKYYSEYYSNAARQYIAKERLKDARERAEEEEILSTISKVGKEKDTVESGLSLGGKAAAQGDGPGAFAQGSAYESSDNRGGAQISGAMVSASAKGALGSARAQAGSDFNRNATDDSIRARLRRKVRSKATDSAKQSRRRRKFIPIAAGVAVALTILFLQYNRLVFAPLMAYVSPGNAPATEIEALDPTITQTVSSEPRLIIPKLNIDVPITFGLQVSDVMEAMNHGVAHYRLAGASAYPGQRGNFIITGHSAGDIYSSNPYKYIFSGLERLEDGDLIYVNYESVRYTYQVTKKEVVEPSNVGALIIQTDRPILTLVTCTPLGTSRYRLLVTAEQIAPEWDENAAHENEADQETPVIDQATELPSNEPSFFERIWNWLTGQG